MSTGAGSQLQHVLRDNHIINKNVIGKNVSVCNFEPGGGFGKITLENWISYMKTYGGGAFTSSTMTYSKYTDCLNINISKLDNMLIEHLKTSLADTESTLYNLLHVDKHDPSQIDIQVGKYVLEIKEVILKFANNPLDSEETKESCDWSISNISLDTPSTSITINEFNMYSKASDFKYLADTIKKLNPSAEVIIMCSIDKFMCYDYFIASSMADIHMFLHGTYGVSEDVFYIDGSDMRKFVASGAEIRLHSGEPTPQFRQIMKTI